ncbi:hypothetical protein Acr_00g0100940 [Actinidia rufa]|uniref:Uncharacterized protein n=1 Tax=Actinidia rufa TaxID=165716 RepID=A0A7J0E1P7_9ERIC|nr:hypothetical protein Acr_00g0100940 [Actinidia rufa]
MVRTKHASNDPRGNDPNSASTEMVFKPRMFKTMEIQRMWLSEFKDRGISIDSTEDEREEDKGNEGTCRRAMEVEENHEIPPFIQWLGDFYEKQGKNIDRLGALYKNMYEQHTAFNQQYSNQMAEIKAQLEGL